MPQGLAPPGKKSLFKADLPTEAPTALGHKRCTHHILRGHILTAPHSSCSFNKGVEPRCSTPSCCSTAEQTLFYSNFRFWEKDRNYSHILGAPGNAAPLQSFGEKHQSSSKPTAMAALQHHHRPAACYLLKYTLRASLRNTRGCQFLWSAVNHEDQPLLEQPRSSQAIQMLTSLLCTH